MKINIWGTEIQATNLDETIRYIKNYNFKTPNYICLPDMYVLTQCYKSKTVRDMINGAQMALPDGKPIELYARFKGYRNIRTVSGFWLCKALLKTNISHFFYGTDDKTLKLLKENIEKEFPNAKILGYKAPPIVQVDNISQSDVICRDVQYINQLSPDIIWIGISSPKQDYLMNYMMTYLNQGLIIGIGGVFDYLAETVKISPEWIKKINLRWLYRLSQNPMGFWKKNYEILYNLPIIILRELVHSYKSK